ncbi:nuclear transport factor 2 family protein [Pseudomonas brassicacearum]|nr:nuclear transport factor 2 family protein [Pseudomonas brassicacearum]
MDLEKHYRSILKDIVDAFNKMELSSIMSCFTDDVVVRYNEHIIAGADSLRAFLLERYADLTEYKLEKTLRVFSADVAGVEVVARYTKKSSGERMIVRIHEFLEFEGRKIKRWDYVGHVAVA